MIAKRRQTSFDELGRPFCIHWITLGNSARRLIGERIGTLIGRITRMALGPMPLDAPYALVAVDGNEQPLPQVLIFDRLFGAGAPAVALPTNDPLGNPIA
jgi:hypothetical protein